MADYADKTADPDGASDLMKRAHRRTHLILWLILGPVMVITLLLAVMHRPADPINDSLPSALIEGAR